MRSLPVISCKHSAIKYQPSSMFNFLLFFWYDKWDARWKVFRTGFLLSNAFKMWKRLVKCVANKLIFYQFLSINPFSSFPCFFFLLQYHQRNDAWFDIKLHTVTFNKLCISNAIRHALNYIFKKKKDWTRNYSIFHFMAMKLYMTSIYKGRKGNKIHNMKILYFINRLGDIVCFFI